MLQNKHSSLFFAHSFFFISGSLHGISFASNNTLWLQFSLFCMTTACWHPWNCKCLKPGFRGESFANVHFLEIVCYWVSFSTPETRDSAHSTEWTWFSWSGIVSTLSDFQKEGITFSSTLPRWALPFQNESAWTVIMLPGGVSPTVDCLWKKSG